MSLPIYFKSAGIIPFNKEGVWFAKMSQGLADFGGKRMATRDDEMENAWETTQREMEEEHDVCFI